MFYDAIAHKYQSYAVGLLLSWSSLDCSAGLKKLKEFGGATISAVSKSGFSFDSTVSEFIDYFTTSEDTVSKLLEIKNSYLENYAYEEKEISAFDEDIYNSIINIIFLKTGTNFHNYKHQTLRRRIAKRMVLTKQESAAKYLTLLKSNIGEQDLLYNDFLISVTYFFRDQQFFDNLPKTVFPSLVENAVDKELRIWSAGCSTGEEVYSLAMMLDEYLENTNNQDITVKIFASDLSGKCIEKARAGVYTLQDLKNINDKRKAKYFTKKDSGYHINKIIRDNCIFAVHDLSKDFPFSRIDFILCRNVLIYFDPELQTQVLSSFHYALREKGFLFLGRAETAHNVKSLFAVVDKKEKMYVRKDVANHSLPYIFPNSDEKIKNSIAAKASSLRKDFKKITADILLEEFSPVAVLINEDFEILHFHGDTSSFLQPPTGKPSFNIINMVHHEIRYELTNAILKARNEKKKIECLNISVKNQSYLTSFEVVNIASHAELLLVIFNRKPIIELAHQKIDAVNTEKELSLLHEDFKQLSEEQQIYFEELRTTNEELLRRTEELQLLNEQLEVSAEELLSNNAELLYTNDELQKSRNELSSMRNFYESIVKSIKEPLLIIDKNFIVRNANPAFYSYFRTQEEQTEGYSIFELENLQWNSPQIKETILTKIRRNETVENIKIEFNLHSGRKKIMLVNTAPIVDSIPEGMILIAMEDITDLEESNESLKIKNTELESNNKQLESFTLAASNNLLEPIRKIYMFGKKITDNESGLSDSGNHNLKRLLYTAVNMNQLIEDLINYSKINFTEKKFKKTDLNLIIKKVLTDLKTIIKQRNAVITTDDLPSMNIISWQIQLLFTHLITNAVKYSKQDKDVQIRISVTYPEIDEFNLINADSYTDYIKITVSDDGTGFNKDYEKLIFEPFYKLQSDESQYGTGLGLALVKQIVSNHKGFVNATSNPGEGTSINIYLPLETSLLKSYSQN
jgi:two-component system CheB/CheR fusion protein